MRFLFDTGRVERKDRKMVKEIVLKKSVKEVSKQIKNTVTKRLKFVLFVKIYQNSIT